MNQDSLNFLLRELHQEYLRQLNKLFRHYRDKAICWRPTIQTSLYVHLVRVQNLHQAMAYKFLNLD